MTCKSSGQAHPVDLRSVVAQAVSLLEQRLRSTRTRVETTFPDEPLYALCDANRLEQVVVNLIGNALDAMVAQTDPHLEISGVANANTVCMMFRDHGPGLDAEVLPRLFEPFFTTKDAGEGLGLGLAISAGIVRDFGGILHGRNHPDGGAVFTFEIPRAVEVDRT